MCGKNIEQEQLLVGFFMSNNQELVKTATNHRDINVCQY